MADNGLSKEEEKRYKNRAKAGYKDAVRAFEKQQAAQRRVLRGQVSEGNSNPGRGFTPEKEQELRRKGAYGKLPDGTKIEKKHSRAYNAALKRVGGDTSRVSQSKTNGKFETHRTASAAKKSQNMKNAGAKRQANKKK